MIIYISYAILGQSQRAKSRTGFDLVLCIYIYSFVPHSASNTLFFSLVTGLPSYLMSNSSHNMRLFFRFHSFLFIHYFYSQIKTNHLKKPTKIIKDVFLLGKSQSYITGLGEFLTDELGV